MARPKITNSEQPIQYTRRHVVAVWWATCGLSDDAYPPWPIQIPIEVKEWEPDRAISFMLSYLEEKDRTHPPNFGSWTQIAKDALARVPS